MQGEKWAGRQEGGGEEEAEKPGNITVRGKKNTSVIYFSNLSLSGGGGKRKG